MTLLSMLLAETRTGPVRWASLPPAWMLVLLVLVGFFWIRMLYARERGRAGPMQRAALTVIRTAVLLLVLLILGGPYREETQTTADPAHLVVLIDTSASMETVDGYEPDEDERLRVGGWDAAKRPRNLKKGDISRADLVRQYLAASGEPMLREWADRFVVHAFAFDGDWRSLSTPIKAGDAAADRGRDEDADPVGDLADKIRGMPFDGGRTRLGALLRNVASEFGRRQDRNLAGVLLISDGRDTSDGESPMDALTLLGPVKEDLRITPVLVGNPSSGQNLWLERIRAKDVVLMRDEVLFKSAVRQKGYPREGREIAVSDLPVRMQVFKIEDENGEPYSEPIDVTRDVRGASRRSRMEIEVDVPSTEDTPADVRMRATFNEAGRYRILIRAFPEDVDKDDAVEQDNVREHFLRVVKTRIKVLYVDYQARHDWRFLSNYLTREPPHKEDDTARNRFAAHVLLQEADRRFVQPSSRDLKPLKHFPRTRKELFEYDVIILGDIAWEQLHQNGEAESRKLLQLLVDFVDAGGGLALQAGINYNNPLSFLDTPLAQLLPIAAHSDDKVRSEADDLKDEFRIRLTDTGVKHPIFAIVPGTAEEPIATPELIQRTWMGDTAISERWYWHWLYRARGGVRPGAVPLAVVNLPPGDRAMTDDRGYPLTVFATMNFGRGRVFWSSLDTIARIRYMHRDEFYGAFWEQVIRYLATYRLLGGNKRFKIFTDKDEYFVGDQAMVTISALDDDFEPLDVEFLDGVKVESPDGETIERVGDNRPQSLKLEGQPGQYRFYLPLKKDGAYRVWIEQGSAVARRGRERAEKRISVSFRAREKIEKMPDLETLEAIASETNPGSHEIGAIRLYDLADHVKQIEDRRRERVLSRRDDEQWDKWWVLLLIVGLLAIEWALRKRWQMI